MFTVDEGRIHGRIRVPALPAHRLQTSERRHLPPCACLTHLPTIARVEGFARFFVTGFIILWIDLDITGDLIGRSDYRSEPFLDVHPALPPRWTCENTRVCRRKCSFVALVRLFFFQLLHILRRFGLHPFLTLAIALLFLEL